MTEDTKTTEVEAPASTIYGMDMQNLELLDMSLDKAPAPPKCILDRLRQRDLAWRWLSRPSVKFLGMRMYTTYSPDAHERKLIGNGEDTPPGVYVDVENKVCWREDAFLGVIPIRLLKARQMAKHQRKVDQTEKARKLGAISEAAAKLGAKTRFSIQEFEQKFDDD